MPRTLKLTLAYDGTAFHGWQRQPGVRTVQEEVGSAARLVLRHPLHVIGASRTDAGVHAAGQVAHIETASTIPTRNLRAALADRFPDDLALVHLCEVPPGFHATRDALRKRYRYRIYNTSRGPCEIQAQRTMWHVWHPLDLEAMRAAAGKLAGTHDFSAFASAGNQRTHNVRTIFFLEVSARGPEVRIDVEGDGFLYNQVRNLAGTLYEIGRGHWPADRAGDILASRDRRNAGPTAPPHGLCLQWVRYPAQICSFADAQH